MENFDHSKLKGDDVSHLEKHASPETSSNDVMDIPAGYLRQEDIYGWISSQNRGRVSGDALSVVIAQTQRPGQVAAG